MAALLDRVHGPIWHPRLYARNAHAQALRPAGTIHLRPAAIFREAGERGTRHSSRTPAADAAGSAGAARIRDRLATRRKPAHVHFLLAVPGYEPLITHLFQEGAEYLDTDVVFGTKQELVVRFERHRPGPTPDGGTIDEPWFEARYDFVLQPTG